MDLILAFNIAISVCAFLGGWLLKTLFDRIQSLEHADTKLGQDMFTSLADVRADIAHLRAELPDRFVRRDDFKEALDNIFQAIRRLEDKFDKVEKA